MIRHVSGAEWVSCSNKMSCDLRSSLKQKEIARKSGLPVGKLFVMQDVLNSI